MSTHFHDYDSVEGEWTACGRYYAKDKPPSRGIVVTKSISEVSCQVCIRSERFRLAKASRDLAAKRAARHEETVK